MWQPEYGAGIKIKKVWGSILTAGPTGGIIWEVEGRGSGSKGVAHHTDLGW